MRQPTDSDLANDILTTLQKRPNHRMEAGALKRSVLQGVDPRFQSLYYVAEQRLEISGKIKKGRGTYYDICLR